MAHLTRATNPDEATIDARFDSDAADPVRPVSLNIHQLSDEDSAASLCLELSLDEAANIANNLLVAVEFAKRYQKAGGDL